MEKPKRVEDLLKDAQIRQKTRKLTIYRTAYDKFISDMRHILTTKKDPELRDAIEKYLKYEL